MFGTDGNGNAGARLDAWAAEAKAKAERYQAMRQQAQAVSVTASSKDGLVTVTVDSGGNVTDLRITDRVRELSRAQVAAAVLAAPSWASDHDTDVLLAMLWPGHAMSQTAQLAVDFCVAPRGFQLQHQPDVMKERGLRSSWSRADTRVLTST